ncbi:MAG: 2,3,4,5-tetrahydropyridine-2,6-dicarboxylate N-succinyltransferase [Candidatus Cloacimonetes bacterium]|nr:2,3,4,5-tetrahydropyridine-2,6-dicarboxylate N-succinyltransferase [Candidatus Cloacimonadota bacterium]
MQKQIEALFNSEKKDWSQANLELFFEFREGLSRGKYRAAVRENGVWKTQQWVKKGILLGFRMGTIVEMPYSNSKIFLDKSTFPERQLSLTDKVRIVPGGSSVREGAYVGSSVILMPPMYINVGAYVDDGSMIDSHALVGTCAQVGKHVHLSAGSMLGGVLEPMGANPVIVEDNVFIGGNCGLYEGVIVRQSAIIAAGVVITSGTPVYDAVNKCYLIKSPAFEIPANAVVVSGSRPLKSNPEFSVYCPIIIKYRDEKTETSVVLEECLR